MHENLTYNDLPDDIAAWTGLPLSISNDEVMPLDYQAGHSGWVLYGRNLKKKQLYQFQALLGEPLVLVSTWKVQRYCVVRLAGKLPKKAKKIADELRLDVASINDIPSLKSPGLLVMDMDSTAIKIECIDELAKLAGVGEQVAAITEQAMQGELDFATSLRKRVATLKGADIAILQQVKNHLPLTPGLTYLIRELHNLNWKVAIASGGFTYFADYLKDKLHLHAAVANQLGIKNGQLTGRVIGHIIDAKTKANVLTNLASELNLPISQTVAVGDGANDLKMLKAAGLGVAYHAKPKVHAKANATIRHADLLGLLCILSASLNLKK